MSAVISKSPGLSARILSTMLVAGLVAMLLSSPAQAQRIPVWAPPVVVSPAVDREVTNPQLATDSSGDVHVFFPSRPLNMLAEAQGTEIVYTRLHNGKWSQPNDIQLAPPTGSAVRVAVAIDRYDMIHLIWTGGVRNELLYSRAHVSTAGTAKGWTTERILSEDTSLSADIEASSDGLLHLVYAALGENVYYRQSSDLGETWSYPAPISSLEKGTRAADYPALATDGNGTVHAVWSQLQLPQGWPPTEVMYNRSRDNGSSWEAPRIVDLGPFSQSSVIALGNTVHIVWNSIVQLSQRKHSLSSDAGNTWSSPRLIEVRPLGGLTGPPGLAIDSLGRLQMVTSMDAQQVASQVNYLSFGGLNWSSPTVISPGAIGQKSVEQPSIAIGGGNRLHVVYEDDFARIWYTTAQVDSPPVNTSAMPTPIPLFSGSEPGLNAISIPRIPIEVSSANVPTANSVEPERQDQSLQQGNQSLLTGVLGALLVIGLGLVAARGFLQHV